jgi:post-segregation antitoxin (ccd killing protein)
MSETRTDLDELNLSTKTHNALRRSKVHTCAQLLRMGRAEVSRLRWVGPTAMREIAAALATTQAQEWTEQGAEPLPELPPAAAQMVDALGLGDSAEIRRGLARVLIIAMDWDKFGHLGLATDLEHGAR